MAALRAAVLLLVIACSMASVLKAKPNILTNVIKERYPRSIDVSAAHSLINEPKLGADAVPKGYKLELEPDMVENTFKGKVVIQITWKSNSNQISLHAHQDLKILQVEVRTINSDPKAPKNLLTPIETKSIDRHEKKPILTVYLSNYVPKDTIGEIEITFEGRLEKDITEAFFVTSYDDHSKKKNKLVATHLRPNNARKVFPCFDEPAYKTPFDISVRRPKDLIALSNTILKKTEKISSDPDTVWDHFETTLPMSTYSLGIVIANISKADSIKTEILGNEIQINIWSRDEFKEALNETLLKVEKTFKEITEFWNLSLPLKKIDLIALPYYTGVKPADNWGLIIFKESELASEGYFKLSQELMYQWLGGLVSPAWWNDAHINKALVGYLSASTAIKMDNGSELDGKWPMTILYSLYYEFSKRYPHSRITGMKQETTCSKIELLFRMLNYTIGEKAFKNGLQTFIGEKKYGVFTGDDIWKALHKAAIEENTISKDMCVKEIATSWVTKDRLPVVTIERNYQKKMAVASQRVYLRERPHDVPGQDKLLWWIPLVIVQQNNLNFTNTTPTAWMPKTKESKIENLPGNDQFIIVNPEEIGPFPVNYDEKNWNMIAKYLMSSSRLSIPMNTRAKLLHDAWNLAYAGDLSFATALDMTGFLNNERDHLVWDPVFTMIDHIGRHIDCSDVHKKFETYVRNLLTPLYEELEEPKPDDESWKINLRNLAKTFLCRAGYKPCIEEAQSMFKVWMDAPNPDEGNPIQNQFICPVFKWGSQEEWEFGLQRVINFPASRRLNERTYLLKTLAGCPITSWKIQRLLNITILEENGNFTDTDIVLIFSMLTGGSRGYTTLFDFLQSNWDTIKLRFENKTNLWDNLISSATSVFTTQEGLDKVTKLYVERQGEFGSAEHIIEKSLKNIREETKWSQDNLPIIEKWLDEYLKKAAANGKDDGKFIGYEQ